jgi:hypothetical protein
MSGSNDDAGRRNEGGVHVSSIARDTRHSGDASACRLHHGKSAIDEIERRHDETTRMLGGGGGGSGM